MRPINEFILEELLTETIASSIVQKWKDMRRNASGFQVLMHEYKWDEVTDEDLVWHEQAEAKKLAYKRNETWTLFWVDSNDNLLGYSTGNYSWLTFDYNYWKMKSIMPMVRASKGAYSIDEKFTTKFLRDKRRQEKENALALRKNESIRDENLARYEKTIKNNKVSNGSMYAEIRARFDEVTEKYKAIFDEVGSASEEDFGAKMNRLKEISQQYTNVVFNLASVMKEYEAEKSGRGWSMLKEHLKTLDTSIDRYNAAFNRQ